jgi:DNA primase
VAEGLADIVDKLSPLSSAKSAVSPAEDRPSPMARLKAQIGDTYSFVSKYVELDETGRGHCPFHPPDIHPSFAVNKARDFWICFHETNPKTGRHIGGDAISFYKRLTGLPYRDVLRQLQAEYRDSEPSS